MRFKSLETYRIVDVKTGSSKNGNKWGRVHFLMNGRHYNLMSFGDVVDKIESYKNSECYLVTDYVEKYDKDTGINTKNLTVVDVII